MTRNDVLALAARVEGLHSPTDWEQRLDILYAIAPVAGYVSVGFDYRAPDGKIIGPVDFPKWLDSLDAALSLVPSGWSFSVSLSENKMHALASLGRSYPTNANAYGDAATPALALTSAALRAIAERMPE